MNYKNQENIYEAEVLESSTFDENIIIKILIKAGRTIAKPALEVLEMALDPYTPAQVRVSLMAALAYLIMPFDLFPDFMPVVGFSDDFVALTAVLSIWSKYMSPSIRARAEKKLNKLFPFYWMSKLSQKEEKELVSFIKDWLKSHGYNQKDLAYELNIKSSRTSEIILKINELYKKGGMFNIAKNLIKIEQKWLNDIKNDFPENNQTPPYNQLDIDSLVKQMNQDTSE